MVVLTPLEWFAGLTPAGLVFSAIAGRAGGNESVAAGNSPDVATDMLRWMSTGVYTPSLRD